MFEVPDAQMAFSLRSMAENIKKAYEQLIEVRSVLSSLGIRDFNLEHSIERLKFTLQQTETAIRMLDDFNKGNISIEELENYLDQLTFRRPTIN